MGGQPPILPSPIEAEDLMSPATPRTPIALEVLAYSPTDFFHCMYCERLFDAMGIGAEVRREARTGYPSRIVDEAWRLSTWLQDLSANYGEQLRIRVIDPQSPEGLYGSLQHWIRVYPTFIINRRKKYSGWDRETLERLLAESGRRLDLS
jgi:hypothetical protein